MQSVCDFGRSLSAPSPLPVEFRVFAYFGLTDVSRWKIVRFQGENKKNDVIISRRLKDFQSSALATELPSLACSGLGWFQQQRLRAEMNGH